MIYQYLHRRARQTEELRDQKQRLEHEVDERTRELVELSTHLQSVAEQEKASLARELHDELGGLLVGALMDISWADQHLAETEVDMKQRLRRIHQNLASSIDLKRRIIEELRPTLLDNVGFIAALRWQLKETCARAGLKCNEYFPSEEPKLNPDAAIALFRTAQEAFGNLIKHSGAKTVDVALDIDDDTVVFRITDDGKGISSASTARQPARPGFHASSGPRAGRHVRRDSRDNRGRPGRAHPDRARAAAGPRDRAALSNARIFRCGRSRNG